MLNKSRERSPRRSAFALGFICLFALTKLHVHSAQAQVSVNLQLIPTPIYYISDFDVTGRGNPSDLFTCDLIPLTVPQTIRLRVALRSEAFDILEARTQPFQINGPMRLTYRDLRNKNPQIQVERFTYNPQSLGSLGDAILRNGQLPSGRYDLILEVLLSNSDSPIGSDVETIIVSNPVSLDLISPGQNAGMAQCPTVLSTLPQFTWNSDVDRFMITVCELLPTNNSPEDVMQNPPRLRMALQRNQDFFGTPTFQYPSAGLPLLPGRTYYWQVLALLQTASGEVQLPSEIWCFKMHSNEAAQNLIELQQLLNLLATLGLQDILELFKPGGPLAGYAPNGKIRMNGRNVDLGELLALLQNGSIKIKAYNVE